MKNYKKLGKKLNSLRKKRRLTITKIADVVGVDRSHISKIESGYDRPSEGLLAKIVNFLDLSLEDTRELINLAGYPKGIIMKAQRVNSEVTSETHNISNSRKEVNNMSKNEESESRSQPEKLLEIKPPKNVRINKNLNSHTVYSDSVFIRVSNFGITLDFAQILGPDQQAIVASVGMSKEHGKALLDVLKKNLEEKN